MIFLFPRDAFLLFPCDRKCICHRIRWQIYVTFLFALNLIWFFVWFSALFLIPKSHFLVDSETNWNMLMQQEFDEKQKYTSLYVRKFTVIRWMARSIRWKKVKNARLPDLCWSEDSPAFVTDKGGMHTTTNPRICCIDCGGQNRLRMLSQWERDYFMPWNHCRVVNSCFGMPSMALQNLFISIIHIS